MDKKKLSETDIITKFIIPAVKDAGWNLMTQNQLILGSQLIQDELFEKVMVQQ